MSQRYRLLRFGIRARDVAKSERKPVALTFVIDTSGSMEQGGRLELVKSSLFFLMSQLRPDDRLALVEYGSKGRVLLEPTYDHGAMREAIRGLSAGGSTNAAEGLTLGYQLASRFFREEGINRVVLCSDGVANVGPTGPDSILRLIGSSASSGIELSTVGFGMGNYNDVLMEQLANKGDGNYAYVDSISEAERVFGQELNGTLQTIGAEAKIQVEFEPDVVERYRLFGYENRDIADKSFRDDKVDAGEIGLGHTVSALYEIKLKRSFPPRRTIGTLRLRYRPQDEDEFVEVERRVTRSQLASNWKEMEPNARLAAVVAEFAEILRGSFWAKGSTFADLRREIDALESHFRNDKKFRELQSLVDMAATIEAGKESGEG